MFNDLEKKKTEPAINPSDIPSGLLKNREEDISSGRLHTRSNPAQSQMAADGISAGANILASSIQAGAQSSALNTARTEARQLADVSRNDDLRQQNIDNGLKKKVVEQEAKSFAIKKKQEDFNLRHNRWLDDFNKAMENQSKLADSANKLFGMASNNEQIKDFLIKTYGGRAS